MYIIANGSWQENNAKLANKYAIFAHCKKKILSLHSKNRWEST